MVFSEAILQKKRKEILEKKIDFYKDLVKGLMGDKDIQEELMENPEIEMDEYQHLSSQRPDSQTKKDIRNLL